MEKFLILKADKKELLTTLTTNDYRQLHQTIAVDNNIPNSLLVLFYKNKCLSYYERHKLALSFSEPDCDKEILIAAKPSKKFTRVIRNLGIPWLYPIRVKTLYGVVIEEEFNLHQNTLVKHVLHRIFRTYSIPIASQELYHKGRKLQHDEFLADLYFAQDEFCSNVTLVIRFVIHSYPIVLFHEKYCKSLQITLESLTGSTMIDVAEEKIKSIREMKDFIRETRKIPVKQQALFHQGTNLNDNDKLFDKFVSVEGNFEDTKNTITLMVQPYYISVKFMSDFFQIPGDGWMEFTAMTTVEEMKVKLAEVSGANPEKLAFLLDEDACNSRDCSGQYGDEWMLDDISSSSQYSTTKINVTKSVRVEIEGVDPFDYLIRMKDENIKQMRKGFEVVYRRKLVLQNVLDRDTNLLDVPDDEILRFKSKESKSCILS